jgi:hypothetical protein
VKAWTTEVHLVCLSDGTKEVVVPDTDPDSDTQMLLLIVQCPARFTYNGVRYWGDKPTVDPIERKLIYYCEGYRDT